VRCLHHSYASQEGEQLMRSPLEKGGLTIKVLYYCETLIYR